MRLDHITLRAQFSLAYVIVLDLFLLLIGVRKVPNIPRWYAVYTACEQMEFEIVLVI